MHRHGCSPHHGGAHHAGVHHGGHHIHGCHNMNAAHIRGPHHIHNIGPFQSGPYRRRGFGTGYWPAGSVAQQRPILKCVIVFGAILLTVASILIFCGILNFAGVIEGDTFSLGVPLLGFGGVTFIAGLLFTVLACISLKNVAAYQEQTPTEIVSTPPEQLASNAEFAPSSGKVEFNQPPNAAAYGQQPNVAAYGQQPNVAVYGQPYGQPPGNVQPNWYPPTAAPLPASAPPPYGEAAAVYPGQVPEPTSTQAPYPQIGFAVPSVTNP